jgi:hypothetical protein
MSDVRYLRAPAAAEFLHENFGHGSVRSLAKLRSLGGGPKFHKIGSKIVAYTQPDLVEWAEAKISPARASTFDRGAS